MKRCPSCNFPNIDSDDICFKCGTALLEESPIPETLSMPTTNQALHHDQPTQSSQTLHTNPTSQLNSALHTSQPSQPKVKGNTDDLVVKPNPVFDANTNLSAFIHEPTETMSKPIPSPKASSTNSEATSEVAATAMPLPTMPIPPLATSPPSLPKPARILPKYKSLKHLKTLSKLIGVILGLALIAVGVLLIFVYPGLLGIAICIGFSGMGLISIFLGFVLSSVLTWLNDVECNQRKQIELINHIYHKIED